MSDQDKLNSNNNDVSNLVFDWTNPSMSTRSKRETEIQAQNRPTPEEDARAREEELKEAVRARKDELMKQRREKAAGSRSAGGRRVPVKRVSRSNTGSGGDGKRTMVRLPLKNTGGGGKTGGALGIGYRSPAAGKKKPADRKLLLTRVIGGVAVAAVLFVLVWAVLHMTGGSGAGPVKHIDTTLPEYVQEDYLTVDSYSRPGISNGDINGIVIHYTVNPGSTAKESRDYFEELSKSHETRASSHFIIGLDGEVLICVPLDELAYASNSRNMDTISIECCHPDESGRFTDETYASLVSLTNWLVKRYSLSDDDILRHYDVTGKLCPKYFVEHEDAWEKFLKDVMKAG